MRNIEQRLIATTFGIASLALLAGCGGGADDAASPSSLPLAETTTSTSEPAISSTTLADEVTAPSGLTPEMFEGMLETESGRGLLVSSIAGETGLEIEAAECLLDAIPVEMLLEAASSFLGGETDGGLFPADQMATIDPILDSCGIAAEDIAP